MFRLGKKRKWAVCDNRRRINVHCGRTVAALPSRSASLAPFFSVHCTAKEAEETVSKKDGERRQDG